MIFISRQEASPDDLRALHLVKKVFGGEIDTSEPEENDWLTAMGRRLVAKKEAGPAANT